MMKQRGSLSAWRDLASQGERLVALLSAGVDRNQVLRQFHEWGVEMQLNVYFWNPGFRKLQSVKLMGMQQVVTTDSCIEINSDVLPLLLNEDVEGIFVLEGLLSPISETFNFHLRNAFYQLPRAKSKKYLVLKSEVVDLPLNLYPLIPVLTNPLPGIQEVEQIVQAFCCSHWGNNQSINAASVVSACSGLPKGEIELLLERYLAVVCDVEQIAQNIIEYKATKLEGRGLRVLSEPDVPDVGGLDLIEKDFDLIRSLFSPQAAQRGLRPPKGGLLWGLPGTGKSLIAKKAAKKIGATLVSCDWNQLMGTTVSESLDNLDYVLQFVGTQGNAILFFDEFEKAFAGWDSGVSGGVLAKMAGVLLSWLQDHVEPVMMLATINHIDMLPPELIRRFDYVWFFDLPHAGAMYEIFQLHLGKYFPSYSFSDDQWRILFREYRGCTPSEIGNAVYRVASQINYQGRPPEVTLEDLIAERGNFKPASATRTISDQLASIRMEADFARRVASQDNSRFAKVVRGIFETSG